jgi:predicted ATPase
MERLSQSRPTDFVGRQGLIEEIRDFFDRVKRGKTSSRLFGIKGQSGWGKSSLALKLADEFRVERVYIFPVDCRAAKTSYYADLAISRALQWAEQHISPGPLFWSTPKIKTNPFEDVAVQALLEQAQRQSAVVCVIFDQFEEIIHKVELSATFARMRELALAVDEARAPSRSAFPGRRMGLWVPTTQATICGTRYRIGGKTLSSIGLPARTQTSSSF